MMGLTQMAVRQVRREYGLHDNWRLRDRARLTGASWQFPISRRYYELIDRLTAAGWTMSPWKDQP